MRPSFSYSYSKEENILTLRNRENVKVGLVGGANQQPQPLSSDKAIIAERKLLMKAVKNISVGREPPRILVVSENVPADANARKYVKSLDAKIQAK